MRNLFLFILLLCSLSAHSQEFLPAEEAFQFNYVQDGSQLVMQWQIADGYYMYKDRLSVKADGKTIPISDFPKGKMKHDEYFGDVEVYYAFLDISANIGDATDIEVKHQGCADAGLCYPPVKEKITLKKPQTPSSSASEQGGGLLSILESGSLLTTLALFFGAGVLTAFAGCSYPMFPILSKIIIGEGEQITRFRSFTLSLTYVLPIALVYALIGVIAGLFGSNLSALFQTPEALIGVTLVLVAMALSMFGFYELQLPSSLQSKLSAVSGKQKGGSYVSAAIMGFISAFIVSACVVPPIVAAVTYITQTGDVVLGASAMFTFGLGLGFPLLLLGLSASWLLPKAGSWMTTIQRVMGVFLLTAAIWILDRLVPSSVTLTLWSVLALGTGLYLIHRTSRPVSKSFGALVCVFAGVIFSMVITPAPQNAELVKLEYQYIDSEADLKAVFENSDKPVFVDYYADWCVSCKAIEAKIFTLPEVNQALSEYTLVKVDITDESDNQAMLRNAQGVIGPPSFLFFDANGNENKSLRIVGEASAETFLTALRAGNP